MCHERWMLRRAKEAEESREVWIDFERTTPVAEPEKPEKPEKPVEPEEPIRVEAPDEVVGADR